MTEHVDCLVIGAGVIGLAIARRMALSGADVIVLESADAIGTETSARNSEIIHAGIYYPAGSLKAACCVEGKQALYSYCRSRGVEHRRCGKLIVATREDQIPGLEQLNRQAMANGLTDLAWLSAEEVREMEPAVHCVAALHSPSTGIIDSHGLMLAYQSDAEAAGATFALRSPVSAGHIRDEGIFLTVGGDPVVELVADRVVNAAGLYAHKVAGSLRGLDPQFIPPIHYAKGNYFSLDGRPPFSRPIYPLPEPAGLGIHATVDLAGRIRFGPDVEWVDRIDYAVDPERAGDFFRAVRAYYPALRRGSLQPAFCGIRPKLQPAGQAARDFIIQGAETHGVEGLVNLFGIESPGLTASLAIADRVAGMLIQ